jgi:hypothetical protein
MRVRKDLDVVIKKGVTALRGICVIAQSGRDLAKDAIIGVVGVLILFSEGLPLRLAAHIEGISPSLTRFGETPGTQATLKAF